MVLSDHTDPERMDNFGELPAPLYPAQSESLEDVRRSGADPRQTLSLLVNVALRFHIQTESR